MNTEHTTEGSPMSQLSHEQRRRSLEQFLRLVRCGLRDNASEAESAAFRLAVHLAANVHELDEIATRGLIEFAAIARLQPLLAEDFIRGKVVDLRELMEDRYTVVAAEAACEEDAL